MGNLIDFMIHKNYKENSVKSLYIQKYETKKMSKLCNTFARDKYWLWLYN